MSSQQESLRTRVLLALVCAGGLCGSVQAWTSAQSPLTEAVHQIAIDNVLTGKLSAAELKDLEEEQHAVDQKQDTIASYMHSMAGQQSGVSLPVSRAEYLWCANEYVRQNLHRAIDDYLRDRHKSMQELGDAIHALEDATSPAHEGFQPWNSDFSLWRKATHVLKERGYPSAPDQAVYRADLENSVLYAYDIFRGNTPMPALTYDIATGKLWMPAPYSASAAPPPDPSRNVPPTAAPSPAICPTLCPTPTAR